VLAAFLGLSAPAPVEGRKGSWQDTRVTNELEKANCGPAE